MAHIGTYTDYKHQWCNAGNGPTLSGPWVVDLKRLQVYVTRSFLAEVAEERARLGKDALP